MLRPAIVAGVVAVLTACGGQRSEPELAASPQRASSRASCVGMDTTFRAVYSGLVYTACGVSREARPTGGRPVRTEFDAPRPGASCYRAIIQVVVDEKGTPIPETARIVRATDSRYAKAIIDGLRLRKYTPASLDGQPVAQSVEIDEGFQARVVVVRAGVGAPPPPPASATSC